MLLPNANVVSGGIWALSDPTRSTVVIKVNFFFQTELMVEIYSKNLVRAIGKVLLIKFS